MTQTVTTSQEFVDTLRITKREWLTLLSQLEREATQRIGQEKRRDQRKRYRAMTAMLIQMVHPGGSRITYLVRSRNLSRSGFGFLHGGYLHSNTRCNLTLTAHDGTPRPVAGKVVRCRHLQGKVHEVGIKFDKPININEFTTVDDRVV
jgi:hypothetical protein